MKGKAFLKDVKLEKFLPSVDANIAYLSVCTSCSSDNKTIYLMVINKNLEQDLDTEIILKNLTTDGLARTYTLWGNKVYSTNKKPPHNSLRIHEKEIFLNSNISKQALKNIHLLP